MSSNNGSVMQEVEQAPWLGLRTVSMLTKVLLLVCVAGGAFAVDQWTKHLVESKMMLGEQITVIDGVLRWYYILNSGAAFSMGSNMTWVFTIIMCVASVVTLWCIFRARAQVWVLALCLLLGGILGNLYDRLFRPPGFGMGHVVDFISVGSFAIFNIADSCICVAMALVVLLVFLGIRLDGTREVSSSKKKES